MDKTLKIFWLFILRYDRIFLIIALTCVLINKAYPTDFNNSAFTFSPVITLDQVSIIDGMRIGNGFLNDVSLQLTFDTEKAGWWKNGSFYIYTLYDNGMKPTELVGSNQSIDNIETYDKMQLYEFSYKHLLDNGYVLIGQSNINDEFFVCNCGCVFMNSNFNTEPEISANAHVPIFSKAAIGVKLKYDFNQHFTLLSSVYNGYEGTPQDNPYGIQPRFSKKYGILTMHELDYNFIEDTVRVGDIKAGVWYHSGEYLNPVDSMLHWDRGGLYLMGERMLIPNKSAPATGLSAFFMSGIVPSKYVLIHYYYSAGLNYSGVFFPENQDNLGIAISSTGISDRLMGMYPQLLAEDETLYELTYQIKLFDFLKIQPDFQYYFNPGFSSSTPDAFIWILRTQFAF
jgi:porin